MKTWYPPAICSITTEVEDVLNLHDGDLITIDQTEMGNYIVGAWMLRDGEFAFQPIALRRSKWRALWLCARLRHAVDARRPWFDARDKRDQKAGAR